VALTLLTLAARCARAAARDFGPAPARALGTFFKFLPPLEPHAVDLRRHGLCAEGTPVLEPAVAATAG